MHQDEVPSFFGWKPFIVLSGSMETQISVGDLVIVKEVDTSIFKKGDNNNIRDEGTVLPEQVEGIFICNISGLGNLAIFIQTPMGMIVSLSIPVILLIIIGIMNSKKTNKIINEKLDKQKEMEEERQKLKKQNEELKKK